jgi:hypothetical protein
MGKLPVYYKWGKPNVICISNSCHNIKLIEKYLKENNDVLA